MPERVILLPYDPTWPAAFERERTQIAAALGPTAAAIHHVGSTAVPGLSAKPIIDLLVELAEFPPPPQCTTALVRLGYEPMGESGVPGRHWFRKGTPRTHHIHAIPVGGEVGRRQLAFRDWLRTHPTDAHQYAALKRAAAQTHPDDIDSAEYAKGKAAFIERILVRALDARPQ